MNPPAIRLLDDFPPVSAEQWRSLVEAELDGVSFEKKLVTRLYEGIVLQPIYTGEDRPAAEDPSGFPGNQPFVRGADSLRQGWEIRQTYANPDPSATHLEIMADLEHGT